MLSRIQRFLGRTVAYLPTLVVLAALGGLALLGHHYDWKLPELSALGGKKADDKKESDEDKGKKVEEVLHPVDLDAIDTAAKAGIKWQPALPRPLTRYVKAISVLQYDQNRYSSLSTRAPGMVWSVEKGTGDEVAKGEVLALVAAETVARAKSDFQQALIQVGVRKRTLERMRRADESIPEAVLAAAEADVRETQARLRGSDQTLLNFGLDARASELAGLPDEVVAERLRLLELPPKIRDRETNGPRLPSSLLPLKAPFNGVVVERNMVRGQVLTTSSPPQFVVADLHVLWLMLDVRPADAAELQPGQEVSFTPEGATSETARGTLKWISPEVDAKTRTVRARAEVPNPDGRLRPNTYGRLRPNTFGTARIRVGQTSPAVAVPAEAVQMVNVEREPGKPARMVSVVFVRESDTKFHPRQVTLGPREGDVQFILTGLRAGEQIVTAGSQRVKSEMRREQIGGED